MHYDNLDENKYYCPTCGRNVLVENHNIKVKIINEFADFEVITRNNDYKIFGFRKKYEKYRIGCFKCPCCDNEVIISKTPLGEFIS